jgi:hypothetical protein
MKRTATRWSIRPCMTFERPFRRHPGESPAHSAHLGFRLRPDIPSSRMERSVIRGTGSRIAFRFIRATTRRAYGAD